MSNFEESLSEDNQLDNFRDTQGDVRALMDLLRDDTAFLVAVAKADTRPHLLKWFAEEGIQQDAGWSNEPERTGPLGEDAAGVEWQWIGRHVEKSDGSFNNTTPSDR